MSSFNTPARPLLGIAWMLVQCLVFSVLSVMTHRLTQDFPATVIYFIGMCIILLMMLPWLVSTRCAHLHTTTLKLYIARSLAGAASMVTWFYALKLSPVTEATAISFTTPLFTCTLAVLILKERLGVHRLIALIIGFVGAMILLHPKGDDVIGIGPVLALLAAILWSICDVLVKYQLRSDSYNTQIFYMALFMGLITLPFALWQWQSPTPQQTSWIIAIGLLLLANFHAMFRAYNHADLTIVMPFDFSRLIFTSIIAYIFWNEGLDNWTIAGALVIVSSTLYIAYREQTATLPLIKK